MLRRLVLAAVLLAAPATLAQDVPQCVRVEAVVRYGAEAYNHYVRLQNGCDRRARCRVATDVSPTPQSVEVEPGATVEVITFRGSPAREFTPRVSCELAR